MDVLQLKMPLRRIAIIADALERDAQDNPDLDDAAEVARISVYLRYRVAKAEGKPAQLPAI